MNTDPTSSPVAFFAAEVKRVRNGAELTQDGLARATMYSSATIAAIETCRLLPSKDFAVAADKALSSDGHFERLQALVEQSSVLPWFRDLVETERKALSIQTYESYIMPGLCQTADYARSAVAATRPRLKTDEIERAVLLRMSRQEILKQDEPPRLWAIIEEGVLRRVTGGRAVMREMCERLLTVGGSPTTAIQVIPDTRGITAAYGLPFMVLTFAKQQPMAYLENGFSARYVRERDEVREFSVTFDYLRSNALDDEQSAEMIRGYRDEYSD